MVPETIRDTSTQITRNDKGLERYIQSLDIINTDYQWAKENVEIQAKS